MTKREIEVSGRKGKAGASSIEKASGSDVSPFPVQDNEPKALSWMRELLHHPTLKRASQVTRDAVAIATTLKEVKGPMAVPAVINGVVNILREHIGPMASPLVAWRHNLASAEQLEVEENFLLPILWNSKLVNKLPMKMYDPLEHFPAHLLHNEYSRHYVITLPHGRIIGMMQDSPDTETCMSWHWCAYEPGACFDDLLSDMITIVFPNRSAEVVKSESKGLTFESVNTLPIDYIVENHDPVTFADEVEVYRQAGISDAVILEGPPGSGKTSFIFSYAELTRRSTLVLGAGAVNALESSDLTKLLKAFHPDVLLLDDFEYIEEEAGANFFTALPELRKKYPLTLLAITCNDVDAIADAITRPGRGGRILPRFEAPSMEARERVLRFYLEKHLGVEYSTIFDATEMAQAMCVHYTQDWIRSIAERCIIHRRVFLSRKDVVREDAFHPMNLVLEDIRRDNARLLKKNNLRLRRKAKRDGVDDDDLSDGVAGVTAEMAAKANTAIKAAADRPVAASEWSATQPAPQPISQPNPTKRLAKKKKR